MHRPILVALGAAALFGACIAVPEGQGIPHKLTDDDSGAAGFVNVDASGTGIDVRNELSMTDPHMVIGVEPPHGPFSGQQHAIVRGNGFAPSARVWFGPNEVESGKVVRIDANRLQVSVPAGTPGPVEVREQNGDDASTMRALVDGYTYDAFYAEPSTGPTSGGTLVTLRGSGTQWGDGTSVKIGGVACSDLKIKSPTELRCATPPHPAGSVQVSVSTPGSSPIVVDDGFVFADSDNGFKGGLSGLPLAGSLRVGVYNNYTGLPVVTATVVAGDSLGTALTKKTDTKGMAVFNDDALIGKRSVTVAKHCYQPITFVDVPVDTVTVYLNPVMSPDCGGDGGDVPPVGGKGTTPATIKGQLVWNGGNEFKRAPWTNVPIPKGPNEKQAAYLFQPNGDPTARFYLPDASTAVHPDADGTIGYTFSYSVYPGNITLYAVAGLEDRSVYPPMFTAYAFGLVRGISTVPAQTTGDVYILMDKVLDQAMTLAISPPAPGPKGPDRVVAGVAIQLGGDGYAILPNASHSVPISTSIPLSIVGLPGLDGTLDGTHFVSTASAVTGSNNGPPLSIVGKFITNDASLQVPIDGFVQVPVLKTPAPGSKFDGTHLEFETASGATSIDVAVFELAAAGGLIEWTVAAPAGKTSVELPDLGSLGIGLTSGPLDISVYCGHIDPFDYGNLLYRHLSSRGWNAYSYDVFHVYY
ncbi:MAG: IPT/TIG domain-containing protein [Deltaproteobacteria bacterium]|nr:IPT/TIG domain-containing protein [Deltaproteobacteria bacterium]